MKKKLSINCGNLLIYMHESMLYRLDDIFLQAETRIANHYLENKQTPEKSLFDQHLEAVTSSSRIWLIPLAVLTVGLRFDGPLLEYFDLISGLLDQIITSLTRKCAHGTIFLKCF